MSTTTGQIIYKAFAPTLKMMICITIGYVLTKRGIFAPSNAKGNVGLPALVFASMISAFTPENIKAFGPLVLVGCVYTVAGWIFAYIIRDLFYVPPDFQYGIFVMGACSNWGNLPTAVVQTVAKSAPFDPTSDIELGVAYVSLIPQLCAWDFREENLRKGPPPPLKQRWKLRLERMKRLVHPRKEEDASEEEKVESPSHPDTQTKRRSSSDHGEDGEEPTDLVYRGRPGVAGANIARKKSRASSFHSMMESTRPIPATAPLEASGIAEPCVTSPPTQNNQLLPVVSAHGGEAYNYHHPVTPPPSVHEPTLLQKLISIVKGFFMPLTIAIVLGIVCSVVQPIKALFVDVDGWSGTRIPNAPDGNPPLSFITDTASFLGGMTIPAGLILLGASFARLKIPRKWSDMPIAAITAMTIAKSGSHFHLFSANSLSDHHSRYRSFHGRRFTRSLRHVPTAGQNITIYHDANPFHVKR
ncbi:hypothetical protein CI109_106176 [Kwoniella shandongensis]|uniref:Auxin efflux carrier n=1 Tax=Kwoniella shandongensis TaxID=1734106 RepID=A0AAJ8LQY3_9TREE